MTASLPEPRDPSDDEGGLTRPPQRGPRALPPPPAMPAEEAARGAVAEPVDAPHEAERARPPKKPRAGRSSASSERAPEPPAVADPGPPPPLPADLDAILIPPIPPLPPVAATTAARDTVSPDIVSPEVVSPEVVSPEVVPPGLVVPPKPPAPVPLPATVEPTPEVEPISRTDAVASVFENAFASASVDIDTAALSMRGVTKIFGDTRAVDGIDLVVPTGVFYGLVGPNGAGKTTTLSMIAGLLRPDSGTITVGGVDAAAKPRATKKTMGVLPERLRTFDRLTGRQLLYYCGVLRGLPSAVVESRTVDLGRAFDLVEALGRPVSDYSAGMTKKVMLAGAMIHSPRLLVLDEPFESVDPVSSAVILDILGAYVAHGGTVILSSHGMDLVERVCSRVAVMVAGQILAEGTIDEVRGELTLEQRFVELAGGLSDVEGLEWLHTFSG